MTELFGKKEIEALSHCKTTEFKKCTKCGKKYKIRTKENFEYCGKCGARLKFYVNELLGMNKAASQDNQEILKRQWLEALGKGWPCEVRNNNYNYFTLLYFYKITNNNIYFLPRKQKNNISQPIYDYEDYRPLSTPLDFAIEWPTHVIFDKDGNWKFWSKLMDFDIWIPWPNCPKGLEGKTFAIPDDWRPR